MSTSKIICMKHPSYTGESNPDLTCNACCSKFVMRIRAEQAENISRLPVSNTKMADASKDSKSNQFTPMFGPEKNKAEPTRKTNFDGAWI